MRDSSRMRKAVSLVTDVMKKEGIGGVIDYAKSVREPRVALGYSLSGTVFEVGKNVTDITVGDVVACAGEGKACHAEFVSVPRNLATKIPSGIDLKDASFVSIGAIALHAFRRSTAQIGEHVAVIGAGLVGNLVIQICHAAGCKIVAIDQQKERLDLAKQSGAEMTLLDSDEKLIEHVQFFTNGRGVDVVLVCASTPSDDPVNLAPLLLKDRGKVVIVGRVGMNFDRKPYYQKEITTIMTRSLGPGRYDPTYEEEGVDYPVGYVRWTLNRNMGSFLELVASQHVNPSVLVEDVMPVDRAAEAFERLRSSRRVAVLLEYGTEQPKEASITSAVLSKREVSSRLNVALVGPGSFARETLLPILRTNQHFNLKWVIASNQLHALEIGQRYHCERYGTSLQDVIDDDSVNLVVISTPNNLHFPMAIQAAEAGKTVFVEKPLCVKESELDEFEKLDKEIRSRIIVGFNRRYSPHVLKIKQSLSKLDGPYLLNYRVNADLAPMSRWSQDPDVGGGRVIHECCHFFDLFNHVLDSRLESASVSSAAVTGSTSVSKDNFVVTLRYQSGSAASLVYSSLGNRFAERERLEIFAQKTVMFLDDFKELSTYVAERPSVFRTRGQDKGHQREFEELAKFMAGGENILISSNEIIAAMRDTFLVDRLLGKSNMSSASS